MSARIIMDLATKTAAEHHGFRLLQLEVPRDVYDVLMTEYKADQERISRGLGKAAPAEAAPFILEVCGVRISKAEAPVSSGMRDAGRRVLDSHSGLATGEMVTRIYRAMLDQRDAETKVMP